MSKSQMIDLLNEFATKLETDQSVPSDMREYLKTDFPGAPELLAQVDAELWDCLDVKEVIGRCSQKLNIGKLVEDLNAYRKTLAADFRFLAENIESPKRVPRTGKSYSRIALGELVEILTTYTSGGGMAQWAQIDNAKKRLKRWVKGNSHPLCRHLLAVDADVTLAEQWLVEMERELEQGVPPRDVNNSIIFMDVVNYSKELLQRQVAIVKELNRIVSAVLESAGQKLNDESGVALPTGDGMALCLFDSKPWVIANIASDIVQQVQSSSVNFNIKVGLNFAYDQTYTDINGRQNVAGYGINWAARVQGFAELPGQIALSLRMMQELSSRAEFQSRIRSLGEKTDKHGKKEEIFELLPRTRRLFLDIGVGSTECVNQMREYVRENGGDFREWYLGSAEHQDKAIEKMRDEHSCQKDGIWCVRQLENTGKAFGAKSVLINENHMTGDAILTNRGKVQTAVYIFKRTPDTKPPL
jgi:hypothetical protein